MQAIAPGDSDFFPHIRICLAGPAESLFSQYFLTDTTCEPSRHRVSPLETERPDLLTVKL